MEIRPSFGYLGDMSYMSGVNTPRLHLYYKYSTLNIWRIVLSTPALQHTDTSMDDDSQRWKVKDGILSALLIDNFL
jgi:hypothetical protein